MKIFTRKIRFLQLGCALAMTLSNYPYVNSAEESPSQPSLRSAPLTPSSQNASSGNAFSSPENTTGATAETPNTSNNSATSSTANAPRTILINFSNVNIIEFIRFVSRITGRNFIFDENDLQFNVTIISEEPTSIENLMAALLQELRIHGLRLLEQGNNLVIHRAPGVNGISNVVGERDANLPIHSELVTRVIRLNTADAEKVSTLIRPLMSEGALVEVFHDTNHLIVTDITANVLEILQLVRSLDAPNNGLVIGQYVVRTGYIDTLIQLAQQIIEPISQNQTVLFVPHRSANSIFIVSSSFLMERIMGILQYLDQNQGLTRIFDLKDLKFNPDGSIRDGGIGGTPEGLKGQWELDPEGNWVFRPLQDKEASKNRPPQGYWYIDDQGNWHFKLGEAPTTSGIRGLGNNPEGSWRLDDNGNWVFQLNKGKSISPERLVRRLTSSDLPAGHIAKTQFYIYKLNYRHGDAVQFALAKIGNTLQLADAANKELVDAINTVQWLETSNSLVFTGTVDALDKIDELLLEIDTPLRQVFIEMLFLETTIDDSLNYGVNWGTRFGGGDWAGSQAFLSTASPLPAALDTTGIGQIPSAINLARTAGFSQGIVGRTLTHCGLEFTSLGTLVRALHRRNEVDILLTPKILTEDNNPAEVFVGVNIPFPAQSFANQFGNVITQNFIYQDVGARLRVTPQISADGMITLTLEQEFSNVLATSFSAATPQAPSIRVVRTVTKVHMPNEFFLVISGMIQDQDTRERSQVPCLGGIPFIGAGFSDQVHRDEKRNMIVFLRPRIVDTQEVMDDLTKRQQKAFEFKNRVKKSWKYEVDEALEFFNLPACPEDCPQECEYTGCCD